jgi:hypothetical protein
VKHWSLDHWPEGVVGAEVSRTFVGESDRTVIARHRNDGLVRDILSVSTSSWLVYCCGRSVLPFSRSHFS